MDKEKLTIKKLKKLIEKVPEDYLVETACNCCCDDAVDVEINKEDKEITIISEAL